MAFAAAAEVGAKDKAAAFLADYEAAPRAVSRYLRILSQMAVTYGKARLGNYPGAIDELRALGRPHGDGSTRGPGVRLAGLLPGPGGPGCRVPAA